MTMHSALHPDDERLAAYASADREAVSDRELVAHVAGCERCRPIVDELTLLRDALALLPDVAPSRPLRLIPPAPEPAARRGGALEWLRRLAAPAMAAGAGLVLVGAVGASGLVGGLAGKAADTTTLEGGLSAAPVPGAGAGQSAVPAFSTDGEFNSRTDHPRTNDGAGDSVAPTPSASRDLAFGPASGPTDQPWLTLLVAGFGLFGISGILRYSLTPRAG
jgi:hypothetical protein